jgi:hypothetical protein
VAGKWIQDEGVRVVSCRYGKREAEAEQMLYLRRCEVFDTLMSTTGCDVMNGHELVSGTRCI